jgi:MFS family permease
MRAWHRTIVIYFAVLGLPFIAWAARMPEVRSLLGVTTSQLGLIIIIGALGAIGALTQSGRVSARFGTRRTITIGFILLPLGGLLQLFLAYAHQPIGYAVAGLITGVGMGFVDSSINVDGAALEQAEGKSLLPRMHAGYSLGALAGAGLGTVAISLNIDLFWQMLVLVVIQAGLALPLLRFIPAGTGIEAHHADASVAKPPRGRLYREPLVIMLGLGILGMTIAEGAANDWLALSVVDDFKQSASYASIAFAIFNASMTIARFFGGKVADAWGRRRTLEVFGVAGVVGLLLVILSHNIYVAWVGSGLWGVGVSMAFPLFLSAAGEGENAARRVAAVGSFGYAAFLIAPPALGYLGQAWGLTQMFWILVALLLMSVFFARAAGSKPQPASSETDADATAAEA